MNDETETITRTTTIDIEEYQEACDDYLGWCTVCRRFTRDSTEPDARKYDCPECGLDTVVGAENALLMGIITF